MSFYCHSAALILFISLALLALGTENSLLCRDTYKALRFLAISLKKVHWLPLSSLWCRAQLKASHDNGAVQTPVREFKRGHLLQRGGGTTESQLRLHTTLGPHVNRWLRQTRRNRRPGASRASVRLCLPALSATEKINPLVTVLFYI